MQLTTRVRSAAIVEAGRAIAAELGILPGDPVVHLERVRAVGSEALILESSHLPAVRFPGLESRDLAARSLDQVMREDVDCRVQTAVETPEPVILTLQEAELLGVPRNAPALMIRRLTSDAAGLRVEHTQALLGGDRTRYLLGRRMHDLPATDGGPAVPATLPLQASRRVTGGARRKAAPRRATQARRAGRAPTNR